MLIPRAALVADAFGLLHATGNSIVVDSIKRPLLRDSREFATDRPCT